MNWNDIKEEYKRFPVTMGLLTVTVLYFLLIQILRPGQATSAATIYEFGGMFGWSMKNGYPELWRFISPIFVHIGWQHIFFNGLSIYFLGRQLEMIFGHWKFLVVYLLSGIMGNVITLLLSPNTVAAGASTSLFGLFAIMAVLRFYVRSPYLRQLGQAYMGLLVANVLITVISPSISVAGHLGGAIGGALCAFMIPLRSERNIFPLWQRAAAWAVYLAIFAFGVWIVFYGV